MVAGGKERMRVLVTGGSGNLARYCHQELMTHGHEVVLFARPRSPGPAIPWDPDAAFVTGDLVSADDCRVAFELFHPDAVVHLGGIPTTDPPAHPVAAIATRGAPRPTRGAFCVNTVGTYHVLQAAQATSCRRIVFASSINVISRPDTADAYPRLPIDESTPVFPTNGYGLSKLLGEEMLRAFSAATGVSATTFRMMHVWMPHEPAGQQSANPILGGSAQSPVDGRLAIWEYLDARDAAVACRLALEAPESGFEVFYLATDRTCREPHRDLLARHFPRYAADAARMGPDDLIVSIRRVRERLGYAPRHSWRGPEAVTVA
jgi:nucleoside-diphosphate-sugar epimerase